MTKIPPLNILYLGYGTSPIVDFLRQRGECVEVSDQKIDSAFLQKHRFDFLISYGYRHLLLPEILSFFKKGRAINLHISMLPFNRGAHPNLWSLWDNTPSGVTIHCIDEGLDSGDIIIQQEVKISTSETLQSSYDLLNRHIVSMFMDNWENIKSGQCSFIPQPAGGTFHRSKDVDTIQDCMPNGWETTISDFLDNARKHRKL